MKAVYISIYAFSLFIFCFTSCKTLWEVQPKETYSPITLDVSLKPLNTYEDKSTPIRKDSIVNGFKIKFISTDASLKYGVFYSYDSLIASTLVRNRKVIGPYQLTSAEGSKALSSNNKSIVTSSKINFDKTKGQFIYLVPFGYREQDSTNIFNKNDFSKVFTSVGYLRFQITPWDYLKTPIGNQKGTKFFAINGSLSCVYLNNINLIVATYDSTQNKWNNLINIGANIRKSLLNSDSIKVYAITEVHYIKKTERIVLVVSTKGAIVKDGNYNLEILEINLNQKIIKNTIIHSGAYYENSINTYCSFFSNTDKIKILYMNYKDKDFLRKTFLDYFYPTLWRDAYPAPGFVSTFSYIYSLNDNNTQSFSTLAKDSIPEYSLGMKIQDKFIINPKYREPPIIIYSINDNGKIEIILTSQTGYYIELYDYISVSSSGIIPHADTENGSYLILANQTILYAKFNTNLELTFSAIYSDWFPGGLAKSISQGVFLNGKIYVLVNNVDVWEFDPKKLSEDFTRLNSYKIISI